MITTNHHHPDTNTPNWHSSTCKLHSQVCSRCGDIHGRGVGRKGWGRGSRLCVRLKPLKSNGEPSLHQHQQPQSTRKLCARKGRQLPATRWRRHKESYTPCSARMCLWREGGWFDPSTTLPLVLVLWVGLGRARATTLAMLYHEKQIPCGRDGDQAGVKLPVGVHGRGARCRTEHETSLQGSRGSRGNDSKRMEKTLPPIGHGRGCEIRETHCSSELGCSLVAHCNVWHLLEESAIRQPR